MKKSWRLRATEADRLPDSEDTILKSREVSFLTRVISLYVCQWMIEVNEWRIALKAYDSESVWWSLHLQCSLSVCT